MFPDPKNRASKKTTLLPNERKYMFTKIFDRLIEFDAKIIDAMYNLDEKVLYVITALALTIFGLIVYFH